MEIDLCKEADKLVESAVKVHKWAHYIKNHFEVELIHPAIFHIAMELHNISKCKESITFSLELIKSSKTVMSLDNATIQGVGALVSIQSPCPPTLKCTIDKPSNSRYWLLWDQRLLLDTSHDLLKWSFTYQKNANLIKTNIKTNPVSGIIHQMEQCIDDVNGFKHSMLRWLKAVESRNLLVKIDLDLTLVNGDTEMAE